MDTDRQLHEQGATGWQRGLYDDITHTFRAPIVNWIFRTVTANEPAFTRYLWGQVKPVFETRAFAEFSVAYRDAVLAATDDDERLPRYRPTDVRLDPAAYRELRGQLATYDVVAPRLAALFEVADRGLHGDLDPEPGADYAATAPFPDGLDRDRGLAPTLVDDTPSELDGTVGAIRSFHGFEDGLPSIYRTLAQWPSYLDRAWNDLEPRFESAAFGEACEAVAELTDEFVGSLSHAPRLAPADLAGRFDEGAVSGVQDLFRTFNTGPVETVLPALPVWAATVDADGRRTLG
jgi:hypothetical protein